MYLIYFLILFFLLLHSTKFVFYVTIVRYPLSQCGICSNQIDENKTYALSEANAILHSAGYNASKRTVLYMHGFIEEVVHESVRTIIKAYLSRGDHNIIILDWSKLASGSYIWDALPNVRKVGQFSVILCLNIHIHIWFG